jgi:hypothetical protein
MWTRLPTDFEPSQRYTLVALVNCVTGKLEIELSRQHAGAKKPCECADDEDRCLRPTTTGLGEQLGNVEKL